MEVFKYCPWDGYRFAEQDAACFICKRPRYKVQQEQQVPVKKWEKILYLQQDFEDNYIDETFLSSVVTQDVNENGPDYRALISKSADLIFAINSVVVYIIMFYSMLYNMVSVEVYLSALFLISVFGGVTYILLTQKIFRVHEILSNLKSITVIISILLLFSPVMLTVNQTYSDDTIYTLTTVCILYHLITKDYNYDSTVTPATWQVNSSTYASLCFSSLLASRLDSEIKVFIMLYAQFLFFLFAQFLKKSIKDYSLKLFKIFMVSLTLIIIVVLYNLTYVLAFLYVLGVFYITFISPLQLIWLYQYKNTIQGPWDLPKVKQYH